MTGKKLINVKTFVSAVKCMHGTYSSDPFWTISDMQVAEMDRWHLNYDWEESPAFRNWIEAELEPFRSGSNAERFRERWHVLALACFCCRLIPQSSKQLKDADGH